MCWSLPEKGAVVNVIKGDSGYGNAVMVQYETNSGGNTETTNTNTKTVTLKGTVYLYDANQSRYPQPSTVTKTCQVLGEKGGYYKITSSAFDPNVVYVRKSDVSGGGASTSKPTSKLPSSVKLVGTVYLYNANESRYPQPSTVTKTCQVLGEKGEYYKITSSAFDPNVVYVKKSDVK